MCQVAVRAILHTSSARSGVAATELFKLIQECLVEQIQALCCILSEISVYLNLSSTKVEGALTTLLFEGLYPFWTSILFINDGPCSILLFDIAASLAIHTECWGDLIFQSALAPLSTPAAAEGIRSLSISALRRIMQDVNPPEALSEAFQQAFIAMIEDTPISLGHLPPLHASPVTASNLQPQAIYHGVGFPVFALDNAALLDSTTVKMSWVCGSVSTSDRYVFEAALSMQAAATQDTYARVHRTSVVMKLPEMSVAIFKRFSVACDRDEELLAGFLADRSNSADEMMVVLLSGQESTSSSHLLKTLQGVLSGGNGCSILELPALLRASMRESAEMAVPSLERQYSSMSLAHVFSKPNRILLGGSITKSDKAFRAVAVGAASIEMMSQGGTTLTSSGVSIGVAETPEEVALQMPSSFDQVLVRLLGRYNQTVEGISTLSEVRLPAVLGNLLSTWLRAKITSGTLLPCLEAHLPPDELSTLLKSSLAEACKPYELRAEFITPTLLDDVLKMANTPLLSMPVALSAIEELGLQKLCSWLDIFTTHEQKLHSVHDLIRAGFPHFPRTQEHCGSCQAKFVGPEVKLTWTDDESKNNIICVVCATTCHAPEAVLELAGQTFARFHGLTLKEGHRVRDGSRRGVISDVVVASKGRVGVEVQWESGDKELVIDWPSQLSRDLRGDCEADVVAVLTEFRADEALLEADCDIRRSNPSQVCNPQQFVLEPAELTPVVAPTPMGDVLTCNHTRAGCYPGARLLQTETTHHGQLVKVSFVLACLFALINLCLSCCSAKLHIQTSAISMVSNWSATPTRCAFP
jgi:hypothetical protein